jgi:hypothetical protein
MPLWATLVIIGVITGTGGYVVRYLMGSSNTLGRMDQCLIDVLRRLTDVDDWRKDRDAELVAYRNGYFERSREHREWWR